MFFRSFLLISLALFCHLSISEFGSVTAEVDEDEVQELKRQLMKEDATKSKQRLKLVDIVQHILDDFEDKIQKHDDGTEKLEGPVYWNAKAGLKSYQPMLAMFKSNMDDQFLVKIMEEQMEKAEKKYQEDLSEDNEAELENWTFLLDVLEGKKFG